jgi:phage terminase large subunit-like protein
MGVAFPEDEFAADYQDAKTDPRKMSKFLRYSLNVWQAADARWFQGDDWAKCGSAPLTPLEGRPCWVGVDLASNLDMTAAAFVFKEADGSYSVVWKYWVPSETVADRVREGIPYDAWIRDGWVTVTDGHRLDHEAVARDIIAFGEAHARASRRRTSRSGRPTSTRLASCSRPWSSRAGFARAGTRSRRSTRTMSASTRIPRG